MMPKVLLAVLVLTGLGGGVYMIAGTQAMDEQELAALAARVNAEQADRATQQAIPETQPRSVEPTVFAQALEEEHRVVLDVRTVDEYNEGHVPGARIIDFSGENFLSELDALDRATPYAVYCRSGNRSGQVLEIMRSLGFRDVVDLSGGKNAWLAADGAWCTGTTC